MLPDAGTAQGVRLTAYFWPAVTLVYSVFEVCRPHSTWMLAMWWMSVASGIAWLPMVPFFERLKRRLATEGVERAPIAVPAISTARIEP